MFDLELLQSLVDDGWLRVQRHPDADLSIFNYTERTQYERYWTSETLACRGLILDGGGHVVARGYNKFFNMGEPSCPELPVGEPYTVSEKIDGSLGILYSIDGERFIASRGSFTSEQAIAGTAMLHEQDLDLIVTAAPSSMRTITPLFEIVYPENRIVVDYGQRRELVLLGAVYDDNGHDAPAPHYTGPTVPHLGELDVGTLADRAVPNAEGYVVSFTNVGVRMKVKFAEYVRLHRIVTGLNERAVWEMLRDGSDPLEQMEGIPDELYAWATATVRGLREGFNEIEHATRYAFARRPAGDRKTIAEYFKKAAAEPVRTAVPLLPALFAMLDGKPHEQMIWRALRPVADDA